MADLVLGGNGEKQIAISASTLNRHGLIAGATGTGKTVSLQVLVEQLSLAGVPVFVPDIKGDLSGLAAAGTPHPKITERVEYIGLNTMPFSAMPVVFWDILEKSGHPLRTTVSEMGPLLLANLLELNETQTGVLYACFTEADERGWMLLDIDDLKSMLSWVAEHAKELKADYGNISSASVGAIKRRLVVLEAQGIEHFLGEPALELADLMRTDMSGRGLVNILDAATLIQQSPRLYSSVLLWLLAELFEDLPEVGDQSKPKLVIFLDEAHLIFDSADKSLIKKIEQVVRLIRSKGVGIIFITQSPLDIPADIAGQLGLKIQHALRAFTARDKKALKAVAESFRENPNFDTKSVLPELGTGEALISNLDENGIPQIVEKTLMSPPHSQIGPIDDQQRQEQIKRSPHGDKYTQRVNRESAHEVLRKRAEQQITAKAPPPKTSKPSRSQSTPRQSTPGKTRRSSSRQSAGEAFIKSVTRAIGSQLGRRIARGILGSIFKR